MQSKKRDRCRCGSDPAVLAHDFHLVDRTALIRVEDPTFGHVKVTLESCQSGVPGRERALDGLLSGGKVPLAVDLEKSITAKVVMEPGFSRTHVHSAVLLCCCTLGMMTRIRCRISVTGIHVKSVASTFVCCQYACKICANKRKICANIDLFMRNSELKQCE
jgi:hypothetical protein